MRKLSALFLAGLMSLALFGAAQPAPVEAVGARIYVGFDVDGTNGGCGDPMFGVESHGAKEAIGHALREANNGDTVYLCAGTYDLTTGIRVLSGTNLSIQGAGAGRTVLDGGGDVRILKINADSIHLNIRDLHFYNGYSDDDGGAICHLEGDLLVQRVTFTDNVSDSFGGAISCYGDSLTILDSRFINNSTSRHGGAIDVHQSNGTVIQNSVFINNHADEEGGALGANGSDLTVTRSQFIGNTSDEDGGAIWYDDDQGLVLQRNTFSGNIAAGVGGAIVLNDNSVMKRVGRSLLSSNRFSRNRADSNRYANVGYSQHGFD